MGVAYLTLSKLLPAFRTWAQFKLIIMSSSHLRPVQLVVSDSWLLHLARKQQLLLADELVPQHSQL